MRIVIVGAGAVGSYLAERLSVEGQDVVVVESNAARAEELQSQLDALVITGNGASVAVLEKAGIDHAKLIIAVTSSDAVNVLACQTAARAGVPKKVARVEDAGLREGLEILGVDVVIDPVEQLTQDLLQMLRSGGFSEIVEFGDGKFKLLGGYIGPDAPIAGITLKVLRDRIDDWVWLIAAIIRDGETIIARGGATIEVGDHVLVVAEADKLKRPIEFLGLPDTKVRKVMVFGASRLAVLTARTLAAEGFHTILIDADEERTRELAASDSGFVVVNGDPTDFKVLRDEGIENVDAVLALTGWDEVNMLGCLVAKSLGVETAIARFHRFEYVGMLSGLGIDAGVSSRLAAANAILRYVRRGRVHSVATFQDTDAEAIELQLSPTSEAVGKSLAELALPKSVIAGGLLRGKKGEIPHGETRLMAGDRLIFFALPEALPSLEKLFGD